MRSITRFPPSPSGYLHVGGARTALFNWLQAKKTGGEMVLRIEDTDRQRSTPEAIEAILESLRWLGLDWSRGPFHQSERFDRYGEVIQRLLDEGHAYRCYCDPTRLDSVRAEQRAAGQTPRYDRHCRDRNTDDDANDNARAVVRFKNPLDGTVAFDDVVRGRVSFDNAQLDDLIIARSDGAPTYNLCVVVDDIDMGITHVIRGDDHTNNTPRQINILRALGASPPVFAHVPLIRGADGQRLSKRHGAVGVLAYRDLGILPEALLNYLVRLGWAHGDREVLSVDEMIELFDLADINPSAAQFDLDKLLWINQRHIQAAKASRLGDELGARLARRGLALDHGPALADAVEALRERARTMEEMADKAAYWYGEFDHYAPAAANKHLRPAAAELLAPLAEAFAAIERWDEEAIADAIERVRAARSVKLGQIAQPLRVAVSGAAATPPIEITLKLVGQARTVARIARALEWIEA
ncbi:MAG: glutamate--tRNA ligase, partial [bacterium]